MEKKRDELMLSPDEWRKMNPDVYETQRSTRTISAFIWMVAGLLTIYVLSGYFV